MNELEKEIFKELTEAETSADVMQAVEPLRNEPKTVESHVLINAAGYMVGEALVNESRKNKYE